MKETKNKENLNHIYLIKGDVSGIQDFIFNVKSKGAAQSLKGRSFFIKILIEVGMEMVFDATNIVDVKEIEDAKISTSGGNFILKISLLDPSIIDNIQQEITAALQYTGLNMMITCAELNANNYAASLLALNQKVRERKLNLCKANFSLFQPFERGKTEITNKNEKWKNITAKLRNSDYLFIDKNENTTSSILEINNSKIYFSKYIISFNKQNVNNQGIALDQFLESLFITDNSKQSFEDLARKGSAIPNYQKNKYFSPGVQKLGALTMDVDNLGNVLDNMKDSQEHRDFDKKLQQFFNVKMRDILNQNQFKDNVYVITAGGDDSFFVGKWNTMLDLALKINYDFLKEFKANNLTISGALVIIKPNFPVVRFAQLAEEAISLAKYSYPRSKGNFNLLGEVLDWGILSKEILPLRKTFFDSHERGSLLTSGLLAKARKTATLIADKEGMQLSDFWQMSYYMRDFGAKGARYLQKHRDYLDFATDPTKTSNNPIKKRSYKLVFPIAARLAEFDKRRN